MTAPLDLVAETSGHPDELAIPYVLGSSVASPRIGEPRTTVDVDLAVRLRLDEHHPDTTAALSDLHELLAQGPLRSLELAAQAVRPRGRVDLRQAQ